MEYRVTKRYKSGGRIHEIGEVVELSEKQAGPLPSGLIEPVEPVDDDDEGDGEKPQGKQKKAAKGKK